MKTNLFENTIRRKLESIQPDFQEQDWAKMQQYMQVHTPPSLWQQYGSWIGYAAAASITTVMSFMYINQLSQNDSLVSDVKNLKNQIEVIKNQPTIAGKTDTVYLVQKEQFTNNEQQAAKAPGRIYVEKNTVRSDQFAITNGRDANRATNNIVLNTTSDPSENVAEIVSEIYGHDKTITHAEKTIAESGAASENESLTANANERVLNREFEPMVVSGVTTLGNSSYLSRKMNYGLASRISSRQVQQSLNARKTDIGSTHIASNANTASDKKVEQTAKADNVIPKFNIKVPYRFGGGIHIEGNGQAKTVVGEVLLAKKFSITAGISWLKVKPMEFFTEKIFREKNRKDFKRTHPDQVPLAFEVYNIKVNPTLVQIPLTIAFRNDIKDNWAYYAGVGTNITLKSKENISFDCKAPNNAYFTQAFDKKTDSPAINSVNFSMGIEKTWHPIVIQAEGYLFTYFQPLTPLSHSAGPGMKLKLLYQIGRKM
ncbi:hypothetical protein [Dyadobacter sp. CY323]|uniref:hypothetical protein n=1 Tax=Dyadobacter sp. CY323 TaxID=2907302 RepID=UPI001F282898|nr:hypothetical protein [Dyadobacter sp. CY323]MCE6990320.1 hypothetical protein [Dyadobacter sp. CY323]